MKLIQKAITVLLILLAINTAFSQSDSTIYEVSLTSGNVFYGTIVEETPDTVRLMTETLGLISVSRQAIETMRAVNVSKRIEGENWFENPQEARYFWQPNGYGLQEGEGYYQNVWVLFNHFAYGVSDHFTLGGGIMPLFLFAGAPTPIWITPKVHFPVVEDKVNIGVGAMLGYLIGEDGFAFGIPYTVVTFGSRNTNLNLGAGWGFADGEFASTPTLSLSGMARVSRRTYLLTENYYIDAGGESVGIISLGARTITRSVGIDYGVFFPVSADIGSFVGVPWIGITIPIGNKPVYQ